MTLRSLRLMVLLGLGVLAGAVLPNGAHAQVPVRRDTLSKRDTARTRVDTAGGRKNPIPAGPDTIKVPTPPKADSMIRNDSIIRGIVPLPVVVKKDTIKTSLARSEMPPIYDLSTPRIYDRAALFATGAVNLSDMLARVPGLTGYTVGFLAPPALISDMGSFRAIRIFVDGLELDPMDLRAHGTAPINDLPIQALEEVRIERGAEETRVYARTWRVNRTDPFTRADVFTGDLNTNLYRAYFGRRYDHGETIQFSAEQSNTQPNTALASSDQVSIFGRLGLQRGPWNFDASGIRLSRNRAPWVGTGNPSDQRDTVPEISQVRQVGYLRVANGDPESGRWFQALASTQEVRNKPRESNSLFTGTVVTTPSDTAVVEDSVSTENQYVVAGGVSYGRLKLSATDLLRSGFNHTTNSLSARATFENGPLSLTAFGETKTLVNPSRLEVLGKFDLFNRFALVGAASRTSASTIDVMFSAPLNDAVLTTSNQLVQGDTLVTEDSVVVTRYQIDHRTNLRAELGVRIGDVWVAGGVLRRGPTTLLPPAELGGVYGSSSVWRTEGQATASLLTVRGRLYKALYADAWAVAYNDSLGYYRPKYQTRAELYIQTNLLDKFPKGNFGLLGSLSHEYRSTSLFPVDAVINRTVPGYRLLSFKLEIRIQTAVVSYQFRNLLQERYAQVPGFLMPRQVQFYGLRWDFWN